MPRRTRRQVLDELSMAGRAHSTGVVLFHTALAAKQGLGPTETKALDLLERFGPMTAGEFGTRTGLAPASVTGLVDRLEQKGFAKRVKDPGDGRRVLVEYDRASMARFAPHFSDFMQGMEALYARYSVEELEVVLRFLTEVTKVQTDAAVKLNASS
jgi:DNA-binding MarR family transcriptional regulator